MVHYKQHNLYCVMNIFVLSTIIKNCARYHNNLHCIKMILESAQMLCSVHRICDPELKEKHDQNNLYRLAFKNHPCTIWVRASVENYNWLYQLFIELCREYTYRRNKVHQCEKLFKEVLKEPPVNIPKDIPRTQFAVAMPDYCKVYKYTETGDRVLDAVSSYRNYYICEKLHFCEWKDREVPHWMNDIVL